ARAGREEGVAVVGREKQPHCDALFRCRYWLRVRQMPADRHLTLCRGPQDRVHRALADATWVRPHVDFRFVPGLDIAQLVLAKEGEYPRVVLLDKAHHRKHRQLRGAHPWAQGEIRYSSIGWRDVRRTVEVEFRIDQVRFRLANLRLGL